MASLWRSQLDWSEVQSLAPCDAELPKEPAQNTNRLALAEVLDRAGEGGAPAATQTHLQVFWEALGGKRSPEHAGSAFKVLTPWNVPCTASGY